MNEVQNEIEEITEIIEGSGEDSDLMFGMLIRGLVREGRFDTTEIGSIVIGVEKLIEAVNESRVQNGYKAI